MSTTQRIVLICTATTAALMAGVFYAFSCSVSPGLGRLPDAGYLAAMQSINSAIQNPLFFLSFFGAPVLLLVSTYLQFKSPYRKRFLYLLCATMVYFVGALGVTIFGNIPLNEALDKLNPTVASPELLAAQRTAFESRWNGLNAVRTIASTITVVLVIMACLSSQKEPVDKRP